MHITSKYNSRCNACRRPVYPGDLVDWIRGQKGVWCIDCHPTSTRLPPSQSSTATPPINGNTRRPEDGDPFFVVLAALENAVIEKVSSHSPNFDPEVERAWSVVQKTKALALQPGTAAEGRTALRVALVRLIKMAV